VVIASNKRLALVREYEREHEPKVHHLIAELYDGVDWVLVEGFKSSDLLKIEVWRAANDKPVRYPDDDFIAAVATDDAAQLPVPTGLDVLDLNQADAVAEWLVTHGERFDYKPELYLA
jgi:molybdopterin-guanine dinucleotide biosynthesis protein B